MHSINLTSAEFQSLNEKFGWDVLSFAIAITVAEERNEETDFLNEGISDFSRVESSCMLRQAALTA